MFIAAGCKAGGSDHAAPDATATAQRSAEAGASTPQEDADPVVDLIHTVEATVATSSRVENAHDHPEHLVDGKQETAWNSKTGDLHGWIAFRLPAVTRILRVELTTGFDKRTADGDLFAMNHRIKRVRLSRGDVVLREATLDTETRAVQGVDVDAPGGDFKLEVLETVPGTKKAWRELTVSEFRVWGHAGTAPRNPTHLPKLAVGSLDGVPPAKLFPRTDIPRGPYPTIAELCAAIDRVVAPILRAKFEDLFSNDSHCARREQYGLQPSMFKGGPFEDAVFLDVDDPMRIGPPSR